MKRILVFVLAAVLLVGAAPVKEAKAEEYLSLRDYMSSLNLSGDLYESFMNGEESVSPDDVAYYMHFVLNSYEYIVLNSSSKISFKVNGGSSTLQTFAINKTSSYYRFDKGGGELTKGSFNQYVNNFSIYYNKSLQFDFVYANYVPDSTGIFSSSYSSYVDSVVGYYGEHECVYVAKETAATCTTSGRTWEECSCGAIQNEVEIPAVGHTWVQKEVPGSCIDDSKAWEECSVCGDIQNEVITPASGHVWITKTNPASCTEAGSSWEECSCGAVQNETEIEALGHGILIYEVAQQPTLESEGSFIRTCSVCGEVIESGTIPMVTPSPTPTPTLAPDPELVSRVSDFSLIVIVSMLLMKDFPLNLLLVSCLMCVAVVVFDKYKRSLNKK